MTLSLRLLRLAFNALFDNKVRSALTTLGVIVGTAIVIIVLSVGAGVRGLILAQVTSITPETLWIEVQIPTSGTRTERHQQSGQGMVAGVQITTLSLDDAEDLKRVPNVADSYGLSIGQTKLTYEGNEDTVTFWATETSYAEMENMPFAEGRFFTRAEDEELAQVIVLGSETKHNLFGNRPAVGKKLKLKGQTFKVVGVLDEVGMKFFMNMDEFAFLPVRTAHKKVLGIDHLMAIGVQMENKNLIASTISRVERVLRNNHDIDDPEDDDFAVRTMDEAMEIIDTVTNAISLLLFSIACISLVVGGIGIMNVMYVAVTERTHEIGLKKAIGAPPHAIRFQFLAEAVMICSLGGALGIALGAGISYLVSVVANAMAFDWPFILPPEAIAIGFGISSALGIVFGFAPANKAASLNPIEALRKV
mgnify:CR=1 FL=1